MPRYTLVTLALFLSAIPITGFAAPVDRTTPKITRAEAVALLVSAQPHLRPRVAWLSKHMLPLSLFQDVPKDHWASPYLEVAFEEGLIRGNRARRFRPSDPLRTEEAVLLVTRVKNGTGGGTVLYLPGTEDRWFSAPLQAALSEGIPLRLPVRIGQPIERRDFYAMLPVLGIAAPETVAFVEPPPPPAPQQGATQPRRIALQPLNSPRRPGQAGADSVVQRGSDFRISLPTLGINDLRVIHPLDPFTHNGLLAPLKDGVGHLFSYPGTSGKILIYGHSSGYPWDVSQYTKIFRQINRLNPGDRVFVAYNGTTHVYEVTFKETVPAKDMNAYRNGGDEELILYTCWPPDSIKERYLVHARPVEKIAAR